LSRRTGVIIVYAPPVGAAAILYASLRSSKEQKKDEYKKPILPRSPCGYIARLILHGCSSVLGCSDRSRSPLEIHDPHQKQPNPQHHHKACRRVLTGVRPCHVLQAMGGVVVVVVPIPSCPHARPQQCVTCLTNPLSLSALMLSVVGMQSRSTCPLSPLAHSSCSLFFFPSNPHVSVPFPSRSSPSVCNHLHRLHPCRHIPAVAGSYGTCGSPCRSRWAVRLAGMRVSLLYALLCVSQSWSATPTPHDHPYAPYEQWRAAVAWVWPQGCHLGALYSL